MAAMGLLDQDGASHGLLGARDRLRKYRQEHPQIFSEAVEKVLTQATWVTTLVEKWSRKVKTTSRDPENQKRNQTNQQIHANSL